MKLITFVGFAGSGKDKAAEHLIEKFGYEAHSFAESLKDALASIFVWDRALLEGKTEESRHWREQVDEWWAEKLNIPGFTPRFAMQYIGTEVLRQRFNNDLWILNIERKLTQMQKPRVVLIDGRFPNELKLARRHGGKIIRVRRGTDPEWYDTARKANFGDPAALEAMTKSGVHISEWAWIGHPVDIVIDNDRTLADLYKTVERYAC